MELNDCPRCGNSYLAIRTDFYKDKREFVYCDCCGCIAEKEIWNSIRLEQQTPANWFDFEQQIMKCWNVTDDINAVYKGVGNTDMTKDQIMNALLGMQELYNLKFEELFNQFNTLMKTQQNQ